MIEKTKPIKRNPALVEFSKDHHFGLLLVWKIRQGRRNNIPAVRISQYVIHFYEEDLAQHFADEEKYLFSSLRESDPWRLRAENDHAEIRSLVESIRQSPYDGFWLQEFSDLLEGHIRFEERELFNQLQASMSEEQLLKILKEVPARPHLNDEDWEDHFWVRSVKNVKEKNYAG